MSEENTAEVEGGEGEEKKVLSYDPRTGNNTAEYNRQQYEKNKHVLTARRKRRYATDPEYRERVKANVRRSRKRAKIAAKVAADRMRTKSHLPGTDQDIELPNGTVITVKVYTVGQLAARVGVSVQTVYKWERENIMPDATYRTGGGQRRYTAAQVGVVRDVYAKHKSVAKRWKITQAFIDDLKYHWDRLYFGIQPKVVEQAQNGEDYEDQALPAETEEESA